MMQGMGGMGRGKGKKGKRGKVPRWADFPGGLPGRYPGFPASTSTEPPFSAPVT